MNSKLLMILAIAIILPVMVSAVDCYTLNSSATCEANEECDWQMDKWGEWCETKSCWSLDDALLCSNSTMSCNWMTPQT